MQFSDKQTNNPLPISSMMAPTRTSSTQVTTSMIFSELRIPSHSEKTETEKTHLSSSFKTSPCPKKHFRSEEASMATTTMKICSLSMKTSNWSTGKTSGCPSSTPRKIRSFRLISVTFLSYKKGIKNKKKFLKKSKWSIKEISLRSKNQKKKWRLSFPKQKIWSEIQSKRRQKNFWSKKRRKMNHFSGRMTHSWENKNLCSKSRSLYSKDRFKNKSLSTKVTRCKNSFTTW